MELIMNCGAFGDKLYCECSYKNHYNPDKIMGDKRGKGMGMFTVFTQGYDIHHIG